MTDNEIIKALECCKHKKYLYCKECNFFGSASCNSHLVASAIDLINRQKAEIEGLTINKNAFGLGMIREKERADNARAEAIKKFAERLKHSTCCIAQCHFTYGEVEYHIDRLVKEMVGDSDV